MKRILLSLLLLTTIQLSISAQNQYLVLFKDKSNSPYSITRPKEFLSERSIKRREKQKIAITERDLPPNPNYLSEIAKTGAKVLYKSRWINGALIQTDENTLAKILNLSFVKGLEGKGDIRNARQSNENQGTQTRNKFENEEITDNGLSQNQLAMLGADKMHSKGYKGEGMLIGVLDSGFLNANKLSFFNDLFSDKRVIGTWDFVNNETNVYNDHSHGTNVLSCMAAYEIGRIVGTAYKASYLLLTTEDVSSETKREEANWLFGAEMADSVGVDVINTSLGYSTFDNPAQNYKYSDMNGDRALATRAADWAAQAGILVVASAGNEGSSAWKYIGTPADADSIIAVGAVGSTLNVASFSSYGPSFDGRIKPELSAQGAGTIIGGTNGSIGTSNGTSFSSPLIAGFAASLWQAFPSLSNMQIRDYLIRSATQYINPDNRIGYGIPNFDKAYELAELESLINELKKSGQEVMVFPNPINDGSSTKVWVLKNDAGTNFEYSITDFSGKTLWSITTKESKITLPMLNELPLANVILKVTAENLQYSTKIVR
ncbi:peptidase S8 and S53 subtilisin kexin sedolisin [Emticicia oligotrophica DSM 17448]|uniref:Peptidase S8 and S53 subtilisin kexin sedolisin n=1 Tax=Emticicia oligotrophica (strain DSM 17448 / CIP 109782 / MTCC 6937 / GPTSA100-15) TaxID=929562 RepID=A0ABM5N5Z8_EMTOG|nr:S8 family serine peptidase [Emticicia oligotrophica]AFK04845.1 peptidase S8 and S53 subtilisin kexin sedolisin [Emticicia oligotrophica DSM 17448]